MNASIIGVKFILYSDILYKPNKRFVRNGSAARSVYSYSTSNILVSKPFCVLSFIFLFLLYNHQYHIADQDVAIAERLRSPQKLRFGEKETRKEVIEEKETKENIQGQENTKKLVI